MRFFKSSFFIALFFLFYSSFSYSHSFNNPSARPNGVGDCSPQYIPVLGGDVYQLHVGTENGFSGCSYSHSGGLVPSIPDPEPDGCDAGFKPVTFEDGSVACVPESYNAGDIGLDMHGDGHDNFTVNEDDDGNYTVSSNDPDTDINADNSGLNDYPPADSGGPLPYTPPSDPDVTTTSSPPTTTTSSDGSETTTTEQTTTTNNNDNTTTITTKETTVNNNTGETSVTNTSTTVNNGTGEVSETQTESDSEDTESTASGGATCNAAPVCDGDAIQCATLKQVWLSRCQSDEEISSINNCSGSFTCEGDAIQCARAKLENENYCSLQQYEDLTSQSVFSDSGLSEIGDYSTGSAWSETGATESIDTEVTSFVSDITSAGGNNSAQCPSPTEVSLGSLGAISFSYEGICGLAELTRPLLILLATFFALRGLVQTLRGF